MSTASLAAAVTDLNQLVQQPDADPALLAAAAEKLTILTAQLSKLSEADRAALQPSFTSLLANLDAAIQRLTAEQAETAKQLKALHQRAGALSAYGPK